VNTPVSREEAGLTIKYAMGNEMRPDVWNRCKERYGVFRVVEFYGGQY
jgi:hypothetical protein